MHLYVSCVLVHAARAQTSWFVQKIENGPHQANGSQVDGWQGPAQAYRPQGSSQECSDNGRCQEAAPLPVQRRFFLIAMTRNRN